MSGAGKLVTRARWRSGCAASRTVPEAPGTPVEELVGPSAACRESTWRWHGTSGVRKMLQRTGRAQRLRSLRLARGSAWQGRAPTWSRRHARVARSSSFARAPLVPSLRLCARHRAGTSRRMSAARWERSVGSIRQITNRCRGHVRIGVAFQRGLLRRWAVHQPATRAARSAKCRRLT